jgi:hypothetical protein
MLKALEKVGAVWDLHAVPAAVLAEGRPALETTKRAEK